MVSVNLHKAEGLPGTGSVGVGMGGYMLTFSLKMSHFFVIRHCVVSKGVSPKFPLIVTISLVLQYPLGSSRLNNSDSLTCIVFTYYISQL